MRAFQGFWKHLQQDRQTECMSKVSARSAVGLAFPSINKSDRITKGKLTCRLSLLQKWLRTVGRSSEEGRTCPPGQAKTVCPGPGHGQMLQASELVTVPRHGARRERREATCRYPAVLEHSGRLPWALATLQAPPSAWR